MQKILIATGVAALLSACAGGMNSTTDSVSKKGDGPVMAQTAPNAPAVSASTNSGAAASTMNPGDRPAMMQTAPNAPNRAGNSGAAASTSNLADKPAMMSGSQAAPMVGGAAMYPTKDIVDNAVNSKDHTTLVAAVKAAGLVDTLKSPGPFTVFAPTNAAFAALPAGTVDSLLVPANKPTLTKVLTYHVVPGRLDAAALMRQIQSGGGKATLKTASGGTLTATAGAGKVMVADDMGGVATVTIADVYQSNGVIHVVDKVLLPK